MTLILYQHPLASFCHKVLIALYENATPFTSVIVDLSDRTASADFFAFWPIGKIPVLRDENLGCTLPETSIIIEYLEQHYPGADPLLPHDEAQRLETRLWDRFFDLYVHEPMQKIVGDRLRPVDERDPRGVSDAHTGLQTAYAMLDQRMEGRTWVADDSFSMADCAAAPALFYADIVSPFSDKYPNAAAYFDRLVARPSVVRTFAEARPYFPLFPFADDIPARFLVDSPGAD
jgi:glutathione S-transferase